MDAETISERGRFWLAGEAGSTTPESATHGKLTIDGDGTTTLSPEPEDWKWGNPADTYAGLAARRFDIVGHLTGRSRYVRIESAFVGRAQFGAGGFFAEVIRAPSCLLSDTMVPGPGSQPCVTGMRMPLGPLLPWLQGDMPKRCETPTHHEVRYPKSPKHEFPLKSGRIAVETGASISHDFTRRTVTVTPKGWIEFEPSRPMNIDTAARFHSHIGDLLILLTDQELSLDWPYAQISGGDTRGTLYYRRSWSPKAEFSPFESWTLFPHVASDFGKVLENWMEMREELGPAFHLYLGTRRGMNLYVEHRFVNLIWGLEALHRRLGRAAPGPKLLAKVERVLDRIDPQLPSRDRRWLERLLKTALEPRLAERIRDLFVKLPFKISASSLKQFADRCARRRNDISHFGGPRPGERYHEFVLELHRLSAALDPLYHAAILRQIGVPDAVIQDAFLKGFQSGQIRGHLQDAGLCLPE